MKKSSIFSREYEKKIRRKRFTVLFIILSLFIMIVYYVINFSRINLYVKNIYYSVILKDNKSVSFEQNDEDISLDSMDERTSLYGSENDVLTEQNDGGKYLVYEMQLDQDNKLRIFYENAYGIRYLDHQDELNGNYKFDISPSKNRILIEEISTQKVYLLNEDLNLFNLDPEFFYSNSARMSFYKDDILNRYEGYFWCKNARFLEDDTIVYVSNLPWFGSDMQYIWRIDISNTQDAKHFMTSVSGQNIDFEELTEEGIKVNINNEIKLLTFSFILN